MSYTTTTFSPSEIETISDMVSKGESVEAICKVINVPAGSFYSRLIKSGYRIERVSRIAPISPVPLSSQTDTTPITETGEAIP